MVTFELETDKSVLEIENILLSQGISSEQLMKEIAKPCETVLLKCTLSGVSKSCKDIFRLIRTPHGYCCAFNYFALNQRFVMYVSGVL